MNPRTLIVLLGAFIALTVSADETRVAYPEGYRNTFINYLSVDRKLNPDQTMTLYANADGSVIVGEVFSAKKDSDGNVIESALGRRIPDKLLLVAVMEKRSGWGESSTSTINVGDWDFGAFKADGSDAGRNLDSCRACHSPLKDSDYLYSAEHLPD